MLKKGSLKHFCDVDFKLKFFTRRFKNTLKSASNVFIMGHRFSDLDSLGAAYGLYFGLRDICEVKIVADKENTLARPLIDFIRFSDKECRFYSFKEIEPLIDENSVLIIVDTHKPSIMDYTELYNRIDKVIVIDHHLKANEFAEKAKFSYVETNASSVCEIVTILLNLLNHKKIDSVAATALLSGIMLDTKNFVMNTFANTFGAAAFLRRFRADPVLIKKMFSETVEICKRKYEIISSVVLHENFAFAKTEFEDSYTRISTAQAADELLTINGVSASFVMCPTDNKVNVSARSFGDIDVQNIMARLGGGGHRTAAACQIEGKTFKETEEMLLEAIKEYNNERC